MNESHPSERYRTTIVPAMVQPIEGISGAADAGWLKRRRLFKILLFAGPALALGVFLLGAYTERFDLLLFAPVLLLATLCISLVGLSLPRPTPAPGSAPQAGPAPQHGPTAVPLAPSQSQDQSDSGLMVAGSMIAGIVLLVMGILIFIAVAGIIFIPWFLMHISW